MKKWCIALLVVLAAWHCYPFIKGEKIGDDWLRNQDIFYPQLEEELRVLTDQQAFFEERTGEYTVQFSLSHRQNRLFRYDGEIYGLSPEVGLLFLPDGTQRSLTAETKDYAGLNGLGLIQRGGMLYYMQATPRRQLWLPEIRRGRLWIDCYRLEYRRFDLENMTWTPISEEEYRKITGETA